MPRKKTGKDIKPKENRLLYFPRPRCTEKERYELDEKAYASGHTSSEYVRRACLDPYIITPQPIADIALIQELKRLGSNFNQYQHKLNALAKDTPDEVKRVSLKIEKVLDTLMF